jgi:hypothetical protein
MSRWWEKAEEEERGVTLCRERREMDESRRGTSYGIWRYASADGLMVLMKDRGERPGQKMNKPRLRAHVVIEDGLELLPLPA